MEENQYDKQREEEVMFFVCRSRVVHRIKPVACVIVDHCYGCYCTGAAEAAGGCVMV